MAPKFFNMFAQLQAYEDQIAHLEGKVLELEQKLESMIQLERNHLIRVKNNEEISDDFIQSGRKYLDLTPEKAWKLYSNKDFDFTLIDVSSREFKAPQAIPEAIIMPWEEFPERFLEIQNKITPILIISEDGTNSILACEFLVKHGYFNCSNISGGHKFWKGHQLKEAPKLTA